MLGFQEFIGCHSWRYPKNEQFSGLPRKDGDDSGWVRTLRRLGGGRKERPPDFRTGVTPRETITQFFHLNSTQESFATRAGKEEISQ